MTAIATHSGKTKLAGIIGWPVSHSRSPRLHGFWLNSYGIDGAYLPLAVRPEQLRDAIRALPLLGFAGANVTLPHKEAALSAVDRVTAQARRIGAVNTIVAAADGTLDGSNSDGFGFLENLRQSAPQWQAGQGPAVLLGAGGAARAIAAAL
ncbi:MAG TPA: shikimate dehydrogenase, partial [Dongiaceae bacterium]